VDWCYLGKERFTAPFFYQAIEDSLRDPFNLLFRYQPSIEKLGEWSKIRPGLKPTGFIFHMSRCGSTLVSQMLAALPDNIVISEAAPLDSVLRAHFRNPQLTEEERIDWLRWMISALGQRRTGDEKHYFIKFDAWNTLALPLIRRAYPDVPWLFLYRDPVEVLVSQLGQRGAHMIPGVIDPVLFGMDLKTATEISPEGYCAKVLAHICEAALEHRENGGRLINYAELPEALWASGATFFGHGLTDSEVEAMQSVTKFHAKNPATVFEHDSARKRTKATEPVLRAVSEWLAPTYERLEAARKQ
jgi:hypothetical protein